MRAYEHRAIGDAATGGALANVGGESANERFLLTFGDVVALSGDFFLPDGGPPGVAPPGGSLFSLGPIPGEAGKRLETRDEILWALKVMTMDEEVRDPRFEPGGQFADVRSGRHPERRAVERLVRDRYLGLAATNDDHFVAPGHSDAATGSGFRSALAAYRNLHQVALDVAARLGRRNGDLAQAVAREAAAQHFLTDAFAAGHLRTPVAEIRRYWKGRYPGFWTQLQRRVSSDTATALRELSRLIRLLPQRLVYERTLAELTTRTSQYPDLSFGDLVARCFHDWDNTNGLEVDGGGFVFGDGRTDEGDTRRLAVTGVRAGLDDVEAAYELGRSRHGLRGEPLYEAVREATGAGGRAFVAETKVPRPSAANPGQNWQASDAANLWASPMVGASGPTVGDALVAMLEPGEQFIRQLDALGQGLVGSHGPFALPVLGRWLGGKCCQAYHDGFVEPLARDPQPVLLSLVGDPLPIRPNRHSPPRIPFPQPTIWHRTDRARSPGACWQTGGRLTSARQPFRPPCG
ncbi:MAG: hypothetical protein ACRD2W_10735 [Acidimicrobiales bacterium]